MTPDEARDLLDGTTPAEEWWHSVKWGRVRHLEPVGIDAAGELDVTEEDAALILAAPTLAAMRAEMRAEYRTEYQAHGGRWFPVPRYCGCDSGWGTKQRAENDADAWKADGYATRIIRRYVTKPEEIA